MTNVRKTRWDIVKKERRKNERKKEKRETDTQQEVFSGKREPEINVVYKDQGGLRIPSNQHY